MNWGSFSEFLAMGGHAFYVWGSYGVTFGLLAYELVMLRSRRRATLAGLAHGRTPRNPR